jgi:hypothetical protein
MGRRRPSLLFSLFLSCSLSACGLVAAPEIKEAWDRDYPGDPKTQTPPMSGTAQIEYEILKRVRCELAEGIHDATYPVMTESGIELRKSIIPSDWEALVALSLQVDESTALNPGVALNTPMHSAITHFVGESVPPSTALTSGQAFSFLGTLQGYSLGLGGTLSSTATRIDKFNPVYKVSELLQSYKECEDQFDAFKALKPKPFTPATSSPLILSQLRIKEWLIEAVTTSILFQRSSGKKAPSQQERLLKRRQDLTDQGFKPAEITQIVAAEAAPTGKGTSGGGTGPKPDTVSIELKFIIVTSGNVTPTWHLVRVSANTGGPFFSIGRTRTHDVIITVGPSNANTINANLSSQIGVAVRGSSPVVVQ